MPKFYGQNKKRINPRYFLNESASRSPEEMINVYKSSPQGPNQWNLARNDFADMANGGDASGQRKDYYPGWTNEMFQQVIDAVDGGAQMSSPQEETPGRRMQSPPKDHVEHANTLLYEAVEAVQDLSYAVAEEGYEFRRDASTNLADLIFKSRQIASILKGLQKQRLVGPPAPPS